MIKIEKNSQDILVRKTIKSLDAPKVPVTMFVTAFVTAVSFLLTPNVAFAQAADAQGGLVGFLLPAVLMIAVFWFFLIRPQQKRQKAHQQMLSSVTKGNKIITSGGIHAEVKKLISNDVLEIEISNGVVVKLNRQMVSTVVGYNDGSKASNSSTTSSNVASSSKSSPAGKARAKPVAKKKSAPKRKS